jgi:hypothetical protein
MTALLALERLPRNKLIPASNYRPGAHRVADRACGRARR